MNLHFRVIPRRFGALLFAGVVLGRSSVLAFPPAPHHTIFGTVRNEWGDLITLPASEVILETPSGARLAGSVVADFQPGITYRIEVPMDSGATDDAYKPNAMRPYFQFTLRVKMGVKSYVPMEMTGDFTRMGEPGGDTRIDLTLGEDVDGDGLPDAWERAQLGDREGGLEAIGPNDDLDGDGISNLNEYLAGTYTSDPADGFALALIIVAPESSTVEFLTVPGRSYRILASPDLESWSPVKFRVASPGSPATLMDSYLASDVRSLRVEIPASPELVRRYFKAVVH